MTLDQLFIKYGSDKSSLHHNYSPVYEELLEPLIIRPIVMLELGIGGYHYIDRGGGDLKAFSDYLPYALILGVDLYDKTFLNKKDRIQTYIANQTDDSFFRQLRDKVGNFDVVIDDASHQCPLTIRSFEILFPMVKSGGLYIIEDVHTSYWEEIASDGTDFGGGTHENTTMNYFKYLTDMLNKEECINLIPFRNIPSEDFPIKSITFCNKMIIIKKK